MRVNNLYLTALWLGNTSPVVAGIAKWLVVSSSVPFWNLCFFFYCSRVIFVCVIFLCRLDYFLCLSSWQHLDYRQRSFVALCLCLHLWQRELVCLCLLAESCFGWVSCLNFRFFFCVLDYILGCFFLRASLSDSLCPWRSVFGTLNLSWYKSNFKCFDIG